MSAWSLEETSTWSMSSRRKVSSSPHVRASLAALRAAASFLVNRTGTTRPVRGSRSGTTIPLTSGKLCSHVGSWMTTGTTSHRCSSAREPHLLRRRQEEVREDEDEGSGSDRARVSGEVDERALEPVGRPVELRGHEPLVLELESACAHLSGASSVDRRPRSPGSRRSRRTPPRWRESARLPDASRRVCRATGEAARSAPSPGGGRRRS